MNRKQLQDVSNAQFRYYMLGRAYQINWVDDLGAPIVAVPPDRQTPAYKLSLSGKYTTNNDFINDAQMIAENGIPRPGDRIGKLVPGATDFVVEVRPTNPPAVGQFGYVQTHFDAWAAANLESEESAAVATMRAENALLRAQVARLQRMLAAASEA